jgi:hypothetical protein
LKRSIACSKKGTPAIVTVSTTKARITSIKCAIYTSDLINIGVRVTNLNGQFWSVVGSKFKRNKFLMTGVKEACVLYILVTSKASFLLLPNALVSVSIRRGCEISMVF